MSSIWEDFIDNLKDEAGILAKKELKDLINSAREDGEDFIKEQGENMKKYLTQLANNEITKDQFEGYVLSLKDLTEMEALKMLVDSKARAQRLANGVTDLVINGVLKLV
jgi:hypothetical protein